MIAMPMLISIFSGLIVLIVTMALFIFVNRKRTKNTTHLHRRLAWTVAAGLGLHAIWGFVAVFILKS